MREPKNLPDVIIMLKEIGQWKDRLSSKNHDMRGLKIQNASDATEPSDYVTLRQLTNAIQPVSTQDQHFSIPFSAVGPVIVNQISAPFIVGKDRVGKVTQASVAVPTVTQAPVGVPLIVNIALNNVNIILGNLSLAVGAEGPVYTSAFITPTPVLKIGDKLVPVIVQAAGAAYVTVQLYITRILTS